MKTLEINSQSFVMDSDIEKAFLKGSLWQNLFSPYKYVLDSCKPKNDLDSLVFLIQIYTFASIELTQYIITHPNCVEAKSTLKRINQERKKIIDFVETKYKAISSKSIILDGYFEGDK